jgi:hypothetical protein
VVPTEPPQSPVAEQPPSAGDEADRKVEMAPAVPPPPPVYHMGDYQDAYCVAYVQEDAAQGPKIVAPDEEDMMGIGQGHVVYLNAGSSEGMKPGDHFTIIRDSGELKHPVTHHKIGHRIDWRGQLTLIAVQEHTSTAEVTFACEDIKRGDRIMPFREVSVPTSNSLPSPTVRDRYTNMGSGKASAYVILARDEQIALGQGNIVGVDLGPSQVKPGDTVTIFRPSKNGEELPRVNLGEGVVLRTEGQSAIVRISAAVKEIYVGDQAEIR